MQEFVGYLFVVLGVVLFLVQALHAVLALVSAAEVPGIRADANAIEKIVGALADKFPVAALGVASVWLGSQILGWF